MARKALQPCRERWITGRLSPIADRLTLARRLFLSL
jgi:hypothetical protein